MFGNFTVEGVIAAAEMLVAVLLAMSVREWARAAIASRLHDPTPRLWGRVSFAPRSWFDPFGSGLLPGIVAILWAVSTGSVLFPVAAYAKPAPVDPSYFRRRTRDTVLVSLAGPVMNLLAGSAAALGLRLATAGGGAPGIFAVLAWVHVSLFVFHLLPIPGLDGARMVALTLPPHAREVYRNGDKYLPLWVLIALFVLGFILGIQQAIAGAICDGIAGTSCVDAII
jgi:Zn-dependent protease